VNSPSAIFPETLEQRAANTRAIGEATGLTILERVDSATGVLAEISNQLGQTGELLPSAQRADVMEAIPRPPPGGPARRPEG